MVVGWVCEPKDTGRLQAKSQTSFLAAVQQSVFCSEENLMKEVIGMSCFHNCHDNLFESGVVTRVPAILLAGEKLVRKGCSLML